MGSIQIRGLTAAEWLDVVVAPLNRQPCVETDTGQMKVGDGVTLWGDLPYVGGASELTTRLISGGGISVVTNDVTVASATYSIEGEGTFTAPQTAFNDIALSSAGNQRYVGFFGQTDSTIVKVEGTQSSVAAYPDTPADTCPIGYVLVTDAAYTPEEPQEVLFEDIGGNPSDNPALVNFRRGMFIHTHITQFNPADNTYYYFAQSNIDTTTSAINTNTNARVLGAAFSGTVIAAVITLRCVGTTSAENNSLYLLTSNGTANLITNALAAANVHNRVTVTGLNIPITQGESLASVFGNTNFTTNPTGVTLNVQYIVKLSSVA